MINLINNQDLNLEQRRNILNRALYSQPFFNLLQFIIPPSKTRGQIDKKNTQNVQVNKNFYLTEIISNFGEVFQDTGSLFDISLYAVKKKQSLVRYLQNAFLPNGFIATEARENAAFAAQIYQDTQREMMPLLIERGDIVQGSIIANTDTTNKNDVFANIVLKGFYSIQETYINSRLGIGINESLARDVIFETWNLSVDFTGQKSLKISNDRYPRLVLGFGIRDNNSIKANLSQGTMRITDQTRGLQFSDVPLPIEFFAPRLTCVRDAHIYYLPTEYLLEPFASLLFDIENALNGGSGYELVIYTRTV